MSSSVYVRWLVGHMSSTRGVLTVNLKAIAENWQYINQLVGGAVECAAVVKSNAYGLGVGPVSKKLASEGCKTFFVASVQEGISLHQSLRVDSGYSDVGIAVLGGCAKGDESAFLENHLVPVLVSYEMYLRWVAYISSLSALALTNAVKLGCIIKINTGMSRFGVDIDEFDRIIESPAQLNRIGVSLIMSHFACADEPGHPLNSIQMARFSRCLTQLNIQMEGAGLQPIKASLANSSGVFLSDKAHCAMVRPGIALYGGNPTPEKNNPMEPVVQLHLPILQIRNASTKALVGYGATCELASDQVLAVVAGGYADGIFRSFGGACYGISCGGKDVGVDGPAIKVPMVGRVSMDTSVFDISDAVKYFAVSVGDAIEFIGERLTIDEQGASAGTIGYELLTSLGGRYDRKYID